MDAHVTPHPRPARPRGTSERTDAGDMDVRQLEYFVAIAEEGQITAAARRLSITQPPLSHELARLERELGTQLVRRGPRGVTLTDAGRLLYERATRIIALTRAAEREVSSVGKGLTGTLCLAVCPSAAGLAPGPRLRELAERFPSVTLELREGDVPEVIDLVTGGIADVGVVRTPFPSQGLRCRFAPAEPLVAVMPQELERGGELEVTLAELAGAPLTCDRRTAEALRGAGGTGGAQPSFVCLVRDCRTACSCAASGLGVGLVPRSMLTICDTGDCYIKTLTEKALETRAAVIWKADRSLSPLAERAVALLGELA